MWILRSITSKKIYTLWTRVRNTYSRSKSKSLASAPRLCLLYSVKMPVEVQGDCQFIVRTYRRSCWNGDVCYVKRHLLKVFLKQRSCCVTALWRLPSQCIGLCNHHKRTYQQSKSISHPHKQTLMSVNEPELKPQRVRLGFCGVGWWRQTTQLYADKRMRCLTGKW